MPTSLLDLRDDALEALDVVRDRVADLAVLTETGSATTVQLQQLKAQLAGERGVIRGVRLELDGADPGDFVVGTAPQAELGLWLWQRRTRWALVGVEAQALAVEAHVALLIAGQETLQVVTRRGDTWQRLAARHLGDWREWPRLVEANGGGAGTLSPGQVITIPRRR